MSAALRLALDVARRGVWALWRTGRARLSAAPAGTIAWLLGAAAVLALWAWIGGLRSDLRAAEAAQATLERALAERAGRLAAAERALEAVAAVAAEDRRWEGIYERAKTEALRAPDAEDGALAPVLERVLERLRGLGTEG